MLHLVGHQLQIILKMHGHTNIKTESNSHSLINKNYTMLLTDVTRGNITLIFWKNWEVYQMSNDRT
jgi:hypothetical protein